MRKLYIGNSRSIKITLTDNSGEAFDLTGYTAKLQSKQNKNDSSVALEKELSPIDSPELGILVFELEPTDTAGLSSGTYNLEVRIANPSDKKAFTVVDETIEVEKTIIKS